MTSFDRAILDADGTLIGTDGEKKHGVDLDCVAFRYDTVFAQDSIGDRC